MVIDDLGTVTMRSFGARVVLAAALALVANGPAASMQETSRPGVDAAAKAAPPSQPGDDSTQRFWYDGEHRRSLRVDPEWVADFRGPKPSLERAAQPTSSAAGKAAPGAGRSEVLRDETGAPRALPGGVIVRLREADVGNATRLFADLRLTPVRALDPQERSWLVESPAGLESLALANRLHESGRFESATPNWWRARALK